MSLKRGSSVVFRILSKNYSATPQTKLALKPFSEVPGPKSYPFVGRLYS